MVFAGDLPSTGSMDYTAPGLGTNFGLIGFAVIKISLALAIGPAGPKIGLEITAFYVVHVFFVEVFHRGFVK